MIARLLLAAFVIANVVLAAAQNALAQGRIALVIGNETYAHVTQLHNPANDAADVSQSLQSLGFDVVSITDATLDGLRHALIDFGRAARNADMAVLFFAGHGMELMGENWLLPVDTELTGDVDVATEAVSLRSAMLAVSNAKQLGLVILDACRNNPFLAKLHRPGPSPTLDPGLAPVAPAENVLVAYSARDGTTASDGTGRNSPYTTALLRNLETPGLEIEFLFRNVRDDVMSATNDEQQPFVYGSLSSDEIYLKPGANPQVASNSSDVTSDAGEIAWSFLKQTSDVDTLQRFVEIFPSSDRLSDAKERLAKLQRDSSPANQTYASELYSDVLDEGTKRTARNFARNTPAVQAAWKVLRGTKDAFVLRRFSEQFPSWQRQQEVRQRLAEIGAQTFSGDLLFKAATDPDVLQCYRDDDLTTPVCRRVLDNFPDIGLYLLDFRFRYELCESLGGLGHCRDVWAALRSKALFEPNKIAHSGPDLKTTKENASHVERIEHKSAKSARVTGTRHLGRERFSKQNAAHHSGSPERMHRGVSIDHRSYGSQAREFGRQSGASEHAGGADEHPGGHGRR